MIDNVLKRIHTENGKIILSIILGLGLATIFRKVCHGVECFKYKPPLNEEIDNNIYKFDDKCYKFTNNNINCGKKKVRIFA